MLLRVFCIRIPIATSMLLCILMDCVVPIRATTSAVIYDARCSGLAATLMTATVNEMSKLQHERGFLTPGRE